MPAPTVRVRKRAWADGMATAAFRSPRPEWQHLAPIVEVPGSVSCLLEIMALPHDGTIGVFTLTKSGRIKADGGPTGHRPGRASFVTDLMRFDSPDGELVECVGFGEIRLSSEPVVRWESRMLLYEQRQRSDVAVGFGSGSPLTKLQTVDGTAIARALGSAPHTADGGFTPWSSDGV